MSNKKPDFDVIIIGAGPAGLSASIWCADLGLTAIVIEKHHEPGGQLLSIYNPITNYPGLRTENGREMRDRFLETFNNAAVPMILSAEVIEIDVENTSVIIADGRKFSARSIILATGVRRRKLNIPGEKEFQGKGILESGARDKLLTRNKTVAIIGGGDAALENALILAEYANHVYVIHRRDQFTARETFIKSAEATPKIKFLLNTTVSSITGSDSVQSIELTNPNTRQPRTLPIDILLVRIGVEPNSGLLVKEVDLDTRGYIVVNQSSQTRSPGVYTVGDVANPIARTIITANGAGSAVAKYIRGLCDNQNALQ